MPSVELKDLCAALDVICPMHVLVGPGGNIVHLGKTTRKLVPTRGTGGNLFNLFQIAKPSRIDSVDDLRAVFGRKLRLEIRDADVRNLVGTAMPLGDFILLNLSFGISIASSIQKLDLKISDFAVTDSAVEMLYLAEAKTAAMSEFKRLSTRLNGEKNKAEIEATTDALTGLLNFRALRTSLTALLRAQANFAIMMIDLDFFKAVNDTLGHAAGDQVLRSTAEILREESRKEDVVARIGGDEFTIVLQGVSDEQTVKQIANRIISRIQRPIKFEDTQCQVSASIGTMFFTEPSGVEIDELLNKADTALYQSKRSGRGRNTISDPL